MIRPGTRPIPLKALRGPIAEDEPGTPAVAALLRGLGHGAAAAAEEMREFCGVPSILLTRRLRIATPHPAGGPALDIVTMPFYQERLRLAVPTAGLRLDDASCRVPPGCENPCPIPCA